VFDEQEDHATKMRRGAAAAWAIVMVVPRHVLGLGQVPPSEIIRVAGIGVGGQGAGDLAAVAGERDVRIVALCDVDERRGKESFEKFPEAKQFKRFPQDDRRSPEGIRRRGGGPRRITRTRPRTIASIWASKHVYCEKPLAHSIFEVREIQRAAAAKNVVTQLGNQGHASNEIRMFCE